MTLSFAWLAVAQPARLAPSGTASRGRWPDLTMSSGRF
jgi:hypothetical protein